MADSIAAIPFDGHLVLIRDEREMIVLNDTARLIWEKVALGATAADVARGLAERFDVPSERALADVDAVLADWCARGLIGSRRSEQIAAPEPQSACPLRPTDFTADVTYALCGHPVRLRFQDPDVEDLIRPLLSPWQVSGAAAGEVIDLFRVGTDHVIAANGAEVGRSRLAEEVLGLAIGHVLEISYPDARWLAVFHAGAVADRHRAIVMPGVSGSGKSTLTAALVHSGLRYLSDDVVPLDGLTSRVLPVPLASSLKRGSWPVLAARFGDLGRLPTYRQGKRQRRYLDLSASAGDTFDGMPVRAVVFPHYLPVGSTTLEALRPAEALERILHARCWISLDHADLGEMLQWIRQTPAFAIQYSSIDDATSIVRRLLLD